MQFMFLNTKEQFKPTFADEIKNKIEVQFDNGTIPDVAFEGFKILLDKLIEAKDSLAI